MPEEMRFVLRSAMYGLVVGAGYWLLTGEAAGTAMLIGLGVAAGFVLIMLWLERRRAGHRLHGPPWRWLLIERDADDQGPLEEVGRLPGNGIAPLLVGFGIALIAMGLVFGPALIAAASVPLIIGLRSWLRGAAAEYEAVEATQK